jgi:hypothetical protein
MGLFLQSGEPPSANNLASADNTLKINEYATQRHLSCASMVYQFVLYIALGARKVLRRRYIGETFGGVGGLYYGAREASFEAKASEDSLAGVGGRRGVFVTGGRCIRGN